MPPHNVRSASSSPVPPDDGSSITSSSSSSRRRDPTRDPFEVGLSLQDFECFRERCPSPRASVHGSPRGSPREGRPSIFEASPAFRHVLNNMKSESDAKSAASATSSSTRPIHIKASKSKSKDTSSPSGSPVVKSKAIDIKGAKSKSKDFSSSVSSPKSSIFSIFSSKKNKHSPPPSPRCSSAESSSSESSSSDISCTASESSSTARRAQSFGGNDAVKARAGRRSSHHDRHVHWADEPGTDHKMINVKVIRPRIAKETNMGVGSPPPGVSILSVRLNGTS